MANTAIVNVRSGRVLAPQRPAVARTKFILEGPVLSTLLRLSTALALLVILLLFNAASSAGETVCRPAIIVESAQIGSVQEQQRVWKGALSIDARQCVTASGAFEIGFIREKENAPDLQFVERFTWTAEQMEVAVNFWEDEFVSKYWIHKIVPCTCRR